MDRYNKIYEKSPREIVLLKSRPCKWGRCFFCDYIEDNSECTEEIISFNKSILNNITGEFSRLEIINSASVFELPTETLKDIKKIVEDKKITELFFEAHYMYKKRLDEIRSFFKGVNIVFKTGVESFDNDFRQNYLKKGANFKSYEDLIPYFDSICLMVGIKGQTKDMIKKDIYIVTNFFKRACINIYVKNSTPVEPDPDLIRWFRENYSYLEDYENIEILWNNTDFGVGD